MAKLVNPVLFSQRFKIKRDALKKAGLLDPILNSDTKLFIDPLLLSSSGNRLIKKEAFEALKTAFSEIVRLIAASQQRHDVAWRNAAKRLDLGEYQGISDRGHQRQAAEIREQKLNVRKRTFHVPY